MVDAVIRVDRGVMEHSEPSTDHPLPVVPDRLWPTATERVPSSRLAGPVTRAPITTRRAVAAVVAGLPVSMAVIAWLVWSVSSPRVPAGQCEGIGFGCVLTQRDSVVLIAVIIGVPASIVLAVLGSLVAWMVPDRAKRVVVVGLLCTVAVAWGIFMVAVAGP